MLRSAPVRDRHNCASRRARESPADRVDGSDRAEHPASAEEVHEDGDRTGGLGHVSADGNLTGRAGQHAIDDLRYGLQERRRLYLSELRFPCLGDGELMQRARPGGLPLAKIRLDLGIELAPCRHS